MAVFLYTKNQQIAGVNATGNFNKKEFVFMSIPYLEELVDTYKFGDRNDTNLLVPVHLYEHARNELLDRLNE